MAKKSKTIAKTTSIRGYEDSFVPHAGDYGIEKDNFTAANSTNIETLYDVVKRSPEITASLQAIIEDIMADGWKYWGSKTAVNKAKAFEINANFYKILTNAIMELIITGNAYILKLGVNEEKLNSLITTLTKSLGAKLGVKVKKETMFQFVDQDDFKTPKDLQILKSSTIKINFDDTGKVISYQQQVQGKTRVYRAKDVIHLTTMNIGGQPYGFTSLEPLLSDMGTLLLAKDYVGRYFENDGMPTFLIKMPEATPDDRNYKALKDELKRLKEKKNKYKALITTGAMEVEQIQKFNKDMEYAKLIQHFTQLVLMSLGVPSYRINYALTGAKEEGATTVGKTETGYYKKIAFLQKAIEIIFTKYLFVDFKVDMKFNQAYKLDELREAQVIQIATQSGIMTVEEARERLGMDPELPEGTMPNSLGDENAVDFDSDARAERGSDEPEPTEEDNQTKDITKTISTDVLVSFNDFVSIVEHSGGEGSFDMAKILYYETPTEYVMFFDDKSWKYKTIVIKSEVDVEELKLKLVNAIKILP